MPIVHEERRNKGLHGPIPTPPEVRFWRLVDRGRPEECWEWRGARDAAGYGRFKIWHKGIGRHAHRALWVLLYGEESLIGLVVCHTCHNRGCVNPGHLYAGTSKQNTRDVIDRGTFHPFKRTGVNNPRAVLTTEDVCYIRKSTCSQATIARELGVDPSVISRVKNGLIYVLTGR